MTSNAQPRLSIALISAAVLGYEILLMALFSLIQWHHFAYMVVSIALPPLGAFLRPYVTVAVIGLLCTAFVRIDLDAFRSYARKPTLVLLASTSFASQGELVVAIHEPVSGLQLQRWEMDTEVVGGASVFGGVKHMDLFLVLDASKSLRRTDREDYRKTAAIALVRNLSTKSDIRFGLVEFDTEATLVSPLTENREAVVGALNQLERSGGTDLAGPPARLRGDLPVAGAWTFDFDAYGQRASVRLCRQLGKPAAEPSD